MKGNGFTLIELLVGIFILALIGSYSAASFQEYLDRRRLEASSETLYTLLKFAHSESLRKRLKVYVSFNPGTNWCYGLSDSHSCDCTANNDCQINGVQNVISNTSAKIDSLSLTGMTMSGGTATLQIDGIRGTLANSGTITFIKNSKSVQTSMNFSGLINRCSAVVGSYPTC